MAIKDLVTRNRERGFPVSRGTDDPFVALQRRMNDLFDSFFHGSALEPFGFSEEWQREFSPRVDVKESDNEITLTVELPGMDEKDLDISLTSDALTLKGEKKEEKEEEGECCWHMERAYGSFHRVIPMPEGIDTEKVEAKFKQGILKITIPKTKKAEPAGKKISIKTE